MVLTQTAWLDRTSIRPDETAATCFVAFEIVAEGSPAEASRAAARTILALDVSLSMKGEPLDHVIRSVDRLLDALGDEDEIGIVAFSENATSVVDPVRVDATGKRLVRSRVARLQADRGTNIEAGLDRSASMLKDTTVRRGVVLLSDGSPNVGAHTEDALRQVVRRHRPGISFFSLGYGHDHCEEVLAGIGEAGGGGYEYVPDPTSCARAFARALGTQGDMVASGIELVIAPAEGVELVRFVGREDTRFSRDGIHVSLPDMISGGRRLVVAELRVRAPGRDRFVVDVVRATTTWREPARAEAMTGVMEASLEVVERAFQIRVEGARRVFLARADEVRETARGLADRGQFGAAAGVVRALMREIETLAGFVANDGSPLAEAFELLLDEAMAFERRPSPEAYATFRKATMSKLGTVVPKGARSRGAASQKFMDHIAGDLPDAWLVLANGTRHYLGKECVIGRTVDADVCVTSPKVSRRHAEIFASAGDYWVTDLGSTNPTHVNARVLASAPHKLVPGDVIKVGDVELHYQEKRPSKTE